MSKMRGGGFFTAMLDDVYSLGDGYRLFFKKIFLSVGKAFKFLFRKIALFFVFIFTRIKKFALKYFNAAKDEFLSFINEIKRTSPAICAYFKEKKLKGVSFFFSCVGKAFKSHKKFTDAVISTVLPIIAIIFIISFTVMSKSLTFALDVYVDGESVGVVKDESAYKQAQSQAKKRFETVGSDIDISLPEYRVTLTTVAGLDGTETVCNNIISAVSDSTVNACGIYVNGEFLCAVKSEDTFNRVKNNVLDEYASENGYTGDNFTVAFADEITTVSGLYPDNEKIITADELSERLGGCKTDAVTHTVAEDETLDDIAKKYGVTKDRLISLNKELREDELPTGSVLLIKKEERNMKIKVTETYIKVETTPFDTVSQFDNNLYIGTTMTIVSGVQGRDVVSYTDTYIDGELIESSRETVRYNANSPINQLVKIGTKGIPVDNNNIPVSPRLYRDQGGTFLWPAPDNCFYLSQGYNPSNSHYGIDICSSDSGSSRGRRIVAVADGVVVTAVYHYSWGYYIRVDHGSGVVTGYAHALEGSFRVNAGDYVEAGQQLSSIGTTGNSTGYHLHFEVWLDGVRVNPLPYVYSRYTGVAVK